MGRGHARLGLWGWGGYPAVIQAGGLSGSAEASVYPLSKVAFPFEVVWLRRVLQLLQSQFRGHGCRLCPPVLVEAQFHVE